MFIKPMKYVFKSESRHLVELERDRLNQKRKDTDIKGSKKNNFAITGPTTYRDGTQMFFLYPRSVKATGVPVVLSLSDRIFGLFKKSSEPEIVNVQASKIQRGDKMLSRVPKKGDIVVNKKTGIKSKIYMNEKTIPTTFDGKRFYSFGERCFPKRKHDFEFVTEKCPELELALSYNHRNKTRTHSKRLTKVPIKSGPFLVPVSLRKTVKKKKRKYAQRKPSVVMTRTTAKPNTYDKILSVFGLKRE